MRQIALLQRGVDQRAPAVVRLDEKLLVVVIVGGAEGRIEQVRADLGDDEQPLGRGLATAVLYDDAAACSESGNTTRQARPVTTLSEPGGGPSARLRSRCGFGVSRRCSMNARTSTRSAR